jgi:AcrR family transcriptional regulator
MTLTEKIVNNDSAPPARRRRAPEAARDNILEAAEAMLVAEGPQALKLAEVARAAGVSNATVLHHFGSIAEVQTALMERMVRQLTDRVLAITREGAGSPQSAEAALIALFDAFEARGAARLAAWLELTGEAGRLGGVRAAVQEVMAASADTFGRAPGDAHADFILAGIALALAAGLFGPTLGILLGRPASRARELGVALLLARQREAIGGV